MRMAVGSKRRKNFFPFSTSQYFMRKLFISSEMAMCLLMVEEGKKQGENLTPHVLEHIHR